MIAQLLGAVISWLMLQYSPMSPHKNMPADELSEEFPTQTDQTLKALNMLMKRVLTSEQRRAFREEIDHFDFASDSENDTNDDEGEDDSGPIAEELCSSQTADFNATLLLKGKLMKPDPSLPHGRNSSTPVGATTPKQTNPVNI